MVNKQRKYYSYMIVNFEVLTPCYLWERDVDVLYIVLRGTARADMKKNDDSGNVR